MIKTASQNTKLCQVMLGRLRPEHFALREHRDLWMALAKNKKVEVAYKVDELTREQVPKAVKRLQELSCLRQAGVVSQQLISSLESPNIEPEKCLREFMQSIAKIGVPAESTVMSVPEWVDGAVREIDKRKLNSPYYDLGFSQINKAIRAEEKHLVIVSADSGKGKTSLALNIVRNLGLKQRIPCLFINLEMEWFEVAFRLIAMDAGFSLNDISSGNVNTADLKQKLSAIRSGKLYITDTLPWADISEIMALIREYTASSGIKVVVLDYVQRLENNSNKEDYKVLQETTKALKSLAHELSILIIMIAQNTEEGKLAGAKGMKRDADAWMILEEDKDNGPGTHYVEFPKARHAPWSSSVPLIMDRQTLRIYEIASPFEKEASLADKQYEPQKQVQVQIF